MSDRQRRRDPTTVARLAAMDEADLGSALARSVTDEEFPPTPPIATLVRGRIEREETARVGLRRPARPTAPPSVRRVLGWLPLRRSTLLALLAIMALAAVVGAVILGVPGIRLVLVGSSPSVSPTLSPAPSPSRPIGSRLGLGELTTLEEAAAVVEFAVHVPNDAALGPPDEVYLETIPPTHQVTLVWRPRPGLPEASTTGVGALLMQFPGELVPDQYEKLIPDSTRVDGVTIGAGHGFWIEGGSHFFVVDGADTSQWREERIRLAGNTLVWQEGDLTFRLEADIDLQRAREIAETLAP
jgi:hypothetical protein